MNTVPILESVKNFNNGNYDSRDVKTQIEAGWYDWFCKDSSLSNRTKKLFPKVKRILKKNEKSNRFDPEKSYVFFKNNCPVIGSLYDDFRICDIETGDVIYTIVPCSGFDKDSDKKAELWGVDNNFNSPIYEGTWQGLLDFFEKPRKEA